MGIAFTHHFPPEVNGYPMQPESIQSSLAHPLFAPQMLCYYCGEFRKWPAKLESIGDLFLNLLAMPRCDGFTTGGSAATH